MDSKSCEISIQKPVEDNSMAMFMLRCRIKHYFLLMKAFLMQYKQGVILLCALLAPSIAGLSYFFTKPFLIFITARHPMNALMSAFSIYFIYTIWIVIQKAAIQSHATESYIATLPIVKRINRMIDLLMLCIANNIFLIPLIAVIVQISFFKQFSLDYFLPLIFLIVSILSIEKNMLHKNYLGCFLVNIATIVFCFSKSILSNALFSVGSILLIASVLFMLLRDKSPNSKNFQWLSKNQYPLSLRSALLLRTAKTQTISRLCLAAIIFIAGFLLSFFSKLSLYPLTMIVSVQEVSAFIVSGIFIYFEKEKRKYEPYLNSFPLSKSEWMFRNLISVVFILLIFDLIFSLLMMNHFSMSFLYLFAIVFYQIILLMILYQIRTRFDVFGTLLSSVATVVWIYFSILLQGFL